jgi:hypothetical protein
VFEGEREARELVLAVLARGARARRRDRALARLPARGGKPALPAFVAARAYGRILAKRIHPVLLGLEHRSEGFKQAVGLFLRRRGFEEACLELQSLAPAQASRAGGSKSESI